MQQINNENGEKTFRSYTFYTWISYVENTFDM
jgi:hypothetical protein